MTKVHHITIPHGTEVLVCTFAEPEKHTLAEWEEIRRMESVIKAVDKDAVNPDGFVSDPGLLKKLKDGIVVPEGERIETTIFPPIHPSDHYEPTTITPRIKSPPQDWWAKQREDYEANDPPHGQYMSTADERTAED